jgi:protein TonB
MATSKFVSAPDALEILFSDRNKAYGAYQLRREYPSNLGKALGIGLLLIAAVFILPRILHAFAPAAFVKTADEGPREISNVHVELPVKPPPLPTPKPPVRTTVAFKPPVVTTEDVPENNQKAIDEILNTKGEIGKTDVKGEGDAPPDPGSYGLGDPSAAIPAPAVPHDDPVELFDVQKLPYFPGGERELLKFLSENIQYPALARENGIEGTVAISFVINKDGSISDISILKDVGGGCGKEAVRVIKTMPHWSPGEANGHLVKVRFTLPVRFKLNH